MESNGSNPTQADLFRNFQSYVWEDESPFYDLWSDAHKALEVMDAKPTGDKKDHDGTLIWQEYLFPDGSIASILSDGSGVDDPSSDCGGIYAQEGTQAEADPSLRPDGTHSTQKDLDDINF